MNLLKKTGKENLSRKDQKRIEAELRQKRYNATKDMANKIKILEKKIEELEKKEEQLKELLSNPDIYNDHGKAKEETN